MSAPDDHSMKKCLKVSVIQLKTLGPEAAQRQNSAKMLREDL